MEDFLTFTKKKLINKTMSNLTNEEYDDLTVRMLSVCLEKHWKNELKEAMLKGLTGDDYIEQEARLMKLYKENFYKHD
jgi:ubiquinone/menaquinone biosynthesis C-methylase UbiE